MASQQQKNFEYMGLVFNIESLKEQIVKNVNILFPNLSQTEKDLIADQMVFYYIHGVIEGVDRKINADKQSKTTPEEQQKEMIDAIKKILEENAKQQPKMNPYLPPPNPYRQPTVPKPQKSFPDWYEGYPNTDIFYTTESTNNTKIKWNNDAE
jgi:hypothetical protein